MTYEELFKLMDSLPTGLLSMSSGKDLDLLAQTMGLQRTEFPDGKEDDEDVRKRIEERVMEYVKGKEVPEKLMPVIADLAVKKAEPKKTRYEIIKES